MGGRDLVRLTFFFVAGCGGTVAEVADAGARDAAPSDGSPASDAAAEACPPGTPAIPDAAIYACEAGAPADAGCRASPSDPNAARDPNVYPINCTVTLPVRESFCGGACCGP